MDYVIGGVPAELKAMLREGANMKVIIAGTRIMPETIDVDEEVDIAMGISDWYYSANEIVSGASGDVDLAGERWAQQNVCTVKRFLADWDKCCKAAGPIRNREMAQYADALVAVWDGESKGTANMILEMHRLSKPVYVHIVECHRGCR